MKPSCIACWVTEKAPEITAWLAMIGGEGGEDDERQPQHLGREEEEGIARAPRRRAAGSSDRIIAPCPI